MYVPKSPGPLFNNEKNVVRLLFDAERICWMFIRSLFSICKSWVRTV
jgi:hypothetical protein